MVADSLGFRTPVWGVPRSDRLTQPTDRYLKATCHRTANDPFWGIYVQCLQLVWQFQLAPKSVCAAMGEIEVLRGHPFSGILCKYKMNGMHIFLYKIMIQHHILHRHWTVLSVASMERMPNLRKMALASIRRWNGWGRVCTSRNSCGVRIWLLKLNLFTVSVLTPGDG